MVVLAKEGEGVFFAFRIGNLFGGWGEEEEFAGGGLDFGIAEEDNCENEVGGEVFFQAARNQKDECGFVAVLDKGEEDFE